MIKFLVILLAAMAATAVLASPNTESVTVITSNSAEAARTVNVRVPIFWDLENDMFTFWCADDMHVVNLNLDDGTGTLTLTPPLPVDEQPLRITHEQDELVLQLPAASAAQLIQILDKGI